MTSNIWATQVDTDADKLTYTEDELQNIYRQLTEHQLDYPPRRAVNRIVRTALMLFNERREICKALGVAGDGTAKDCVAQIRWLNGRLGEAQF